ncbi:rhamnogalacturonan acetylesterase [Paenibacillus abyssi]|uniref:Rhamnogalacturonan acetylesterase n=1 Tax=Paenibacillus abyssi TaxID=1340531 RepID=A0A917CMP4_9BACL|nr:GDSL-type esterase/lipase family protein [Paenibacillus abyssi]GGF92917.1 rhamnogalacturonan acetylesterase [Paenibacillus abyssi]
MSSDLKFNFGPEGDSGRGYKRVTAECGYDAARGYGFTNLEAVTSRDRGGSDRLTRDFCIPYHTSFIVDVPNGSYTVSALMGDAVVPTCTTVKAGAGRLMISSRKAAAGQFVRSMFAVHVRDGQLKLSFSGQAPRINALEITPAPGAVALYLAGDSTVTDQSEEGFPYAGWGQMLPMFLKHDVVVANYAESGRSSKSFIDEGRLDVILDEIKAGDFLFIQFGHNDQKTDEERHTDPATTYPQYLKQYIDGARGRQAIPVLVTSVHRRFFGEGGKLTDTHGAYLEAVRKLAYEEQVPLIDLADRSRALFEALGEEGTKSIFMWGAPGEFANFSEGVQDNTHFQEQGAIEIARLITEEIRAQKLWPLALYLR